MDWGVWLAFALATVGSAQTDWKQVCASATAAPLNAPETGNLQGCDSTALYYGFDRPPDWNAALRCAYSQRAHPQPTQADPFYGPGVLAMLYANGRGVPRNYELSIRFTCENTWAAPAEMEGRIAHLEKLRAGQGDGKDFDLCDDATSGMMGGFCEGIRQQFLTAKRRQERDAITASWPASVKEAFQSLEVADEAFVQASGYNEVDRSGSLREAFSLEEEGRLRDRFLATLRRFASGEVAAASASEYRDADRSLNEAYQRIQHAPDSSWEGTTVKPSGIRDTERLWMKLRDAWVEFARVGFPQLTEDTVRAEITRLRAGQLRDMARQ